MVKFLIVGDLHGNKPKIHFKDFDYIIAPGDFCSDAPRKYMFQALSEKLNNPDSKIQWWDFIGKKKAIKMVKKSLADGRRILKFLNSFGVPVFIVPGNWDWTKGKYENWSFLKGGHYKRLISNLDNIIDVYHRIIDIGDFEIIGHGISSGPEYPQHKDELENLKPKKLRTIKREYNQDYKKVDSLFRKARKPIMFISHNVPFNTPIDKITNKQSPRYGYHFGSLIARQMIDKHHPLVCIGGHMHEHFRKCMVGKTTAINAGFGSHVNVLLELSGNRIKNVNFYRGKQ